MFTFQVDIIGSEMKREFSAETDISWEGFRNRMIGYLAPNSTFDLAYKLSSDSGKASQLNSAEEFKTAMERLYHRASNARTRAVSLEIQNMVSALGYREPVGLTQYYRPSSLQQQRNPTRGVVRMIFHQS